MKKVFFASILLMSIRLESQAQNTSDIAIIADAVRTFSNSGDQQDATKLDAILHPQFRAVVHRLFGAPDISLMGKALYLQLIRDKKIGGDSREVHILDMEITNNIATVKAILQGKALRFTTYISLVKLENGTWQIIGDLPHIEKL